MFKSFMPGWFSRLLTIIASCCGLLGCSHEPVSIILEYEVDQEAMPGESVVEMNSLVAAINGRLVRSGRASVSENGRVEVALFGDLDESELQLIERRIETLGTLEFRITASTTFKDHREIIDLAKQIPPDENEVWLGESKVAEWVEYKVDEEVDFLVKRLAGKMPQALIIVNDGYDVTGSFLRSVTASSDEQGRPQVDFKFDEVGGSRFGQLTEKHLPSSSGQTYRLGIIFDNKLLTAPSIQSKITSRGRITGSMGQEEVDFIVAVLNAGTLPYPIQQVSKRSVAQEVGK